MTWSNVINRRSCHLSKFIQRHTTCHTHTHTHTNTTLLWPTFTVDPDICWHSSLCRGLEASVRYGKKRPEGSEMNRLSTRSMDPSRCTLHLSRVLVTEPDLHWCPHRLLQAPGQRKMKGVDVCKGRMEITHTHTQRSLTYSQWLVVMTWSFCLWTDSPKFLTLQLHVSFQSCEQHKQDSTHHHYLVLKMEILLKVSAQLDTTISVGWSSIDCIDVWTNRHGSIEYKT